MPRPTTMHVQPPVHNQAQDLANAFNRLRVNHNQPSRPSSREGVPSVYSQSQDPPNAFGRLRTSHNPPLSHATSQDGIGPVSHNIAFPVPRPPPMPSAAASTSSPPSRHRSVSASVAAPNRQTTLQHSTGLPAARAGSIRRQGTVMRRMDTSELQRAREQLGQRSLAVESETVTPRDGLGPLPPGWSIRQTPEGRTYYADSKFFFFSLGLGRQGCGR